MGFKDYLTRFFENSDSPKENAFKYITSFAVFGSFVLPTMYYLSPPQGNYQGPSQYKEQKIGALDSLGQKGSLKSIDDILNENSGSLDISAYIGNRDLGSGSE